MSLKLKKYVVQYAKMTQSAQDVHGVLSDVTKEIKALMKMSTVRDVQKYKDDFGINSTLTCADSLLAYRAPVLGRKVTKSRALLAAKEDDVQKIRRVIEDELKKRGSLQHMGPPSVFLALAESRHVKWHQDMTEIKEACTADSLVATRVQKKYSVAAKFSRSLRRLAIMKHLEQEGVPESDMGGALLSRVAQVTDQKVLTLVASRLGEA